LHQWAPSTIDLKQFIREDYLNPHSACKLPTPREVADKWSNKEIWN
jgi:hypothetical protein